MAQQRRVALITGSGRNIGRAVALGLAEDGFDVVINGASDRAACEAVARQAQALGASALVVMGDVGNREDATRLAREAMGMSGRVDALVNNAAIRPHGPFLDIAEETWRRVLAVDMEAAIWLTQACLPGMLAQGWGRIVNVTGMNAIQGHAGHAAVSVAKHAVWGLTKSLAKEFAAQGITANAVSPGPTAQDEDGTADTEATRRRQATIARIPTGRLGTPVEIAAVVRTMVSDAGAFINGQMVQVNGGTQT